jgi:Asp-tRNA(Asn)/Glu-tRNA(Gln) amidotransferase C subunit
MSMKFNKAKLSTVITKLENILEAIEAAKEIDEQNEEESK